MNECSTTKLLKLSQLKKTQGAMYSALTFVGVKKWMAALSGRIGFFFVREKAEDRRQVS